MHVNQGDEL